MNPDDFKRADLELLGYTGSVQDMEMAWLYDQGATTGNIKDRWKTYLTGLGYSGSLNDMFSAWLTAKGYSGPLNDLIREALAADNFYGVAAAGYTASATNFDGTNDYMLRGADLTGAADGKQVLISFWINTSTDSGDRRVFMGAGFNVNVTVTWQNRIYIGLENTSGTNIATMQSANNTILAASGWQHVIASIDLATAGSGYIYVNDSAVVSAYTGTNDTIDLTLSDWAIGARNTGVEKIAGCLSEFYYEDTYLDLSVEANRRKFISATGKPVDLGSDGSTPTGASPLVYLPNPFGSFETNAGTGGDFTVTGALTECASSPSDVYTASATNFDGTNDYMLRGGGLTGAADGTQLTVSFWANLNGGDAAWRTVLTGDSNYQAIRFNLGNNLNVYLTDTTAALAATMSTTASFTAGATWHHILISIDTAVANSGYIYVNDVVDVNGYNPLTSGNLDLTRTNWAVGAREGGDRRMNGCLSEIWMEDTYLDLSVEANRRKFIDAWGNPVDLGADGSTPTGASPLVYLPNDSTNFETNAGTGGNFTVTGALTACADSPSD